MSAQEERVLQEGICSDHVPSQLSGRTLERIVVIRFRSKQGDESHYVTLSNSDLYYRI